MSFTLCLFILVLRIEEKNLMKKKRKKKKKTSDMSKSVRFVKKKLGPGSYVGFSELDSLGMLNVDFRM